jgi:ribosomal protein S17
LSFRINAKNYCSYRNYKNTASSYDRTVIKRKKYKVHDEDKKAKVGDRVKIIESRPLSKEKRFKLLEVVK